MGFGGREIQIVGNVFQCHRHYHCNVIMFARAKMQSVCCTQYDVGLCTGVPQLRWTGVVVLWWRSRETFPKSGDTLMRLSNVIIITFGDGNRVKFYSAREKSSYIENCIHNNKILYWSSSSNTCGNILNWYVVNTVQA